MPDENDREATRAWELRVAELQRRIDEICRRELENPDYRRTHIGRIARQPK